MKKKLIVIVCAVLGVMFIAAILFALMLPPIGAPEYYHSLDDALRWPSRVKKLALEDRSLTEVPDGVRQLANLEHLRLRSNHLNTLPEWLSQNKKVELLSLVDNRFSAFPIVLAKMPSLRNLRLSSNMIDELPSWIGDLRSLEYLDLANNNLTDVPDEISLLTRLVRLRLDGNPFSAANLDRIQQLLPDTEIYFDGKIHDQQPGR